MREFGIVVIYIGLGMMVVGLIYSSNGYGHSADKLVFPLFYVGGWFSFIGCFVSLIGSAWPYRKQEQGTSSPSKPVSPPSNNAKAKVAEQDS